jgi:REP element-mobilizing transposase RayT
MAVDKEHIREPGIYFLTFTNYKWLPLFEITKSYDLIYKWFNVLKSKGHYIAGYVIMPNHIHALIGFHPTDKSINSIVGNGKRFIAYGIVERLNEARYTDLLKTLEEGVSVSDKHKGKLHEVFEPSFDLKLCYSYKFLKQKLDYMHSNPVSKKWNLVKDVIDYLHSSARFYETGDQSVYEVQHVNEWVFEHWHNGLSSTSALRLPPSP